MTTGTQRALRMVDGTAQDWASRVWEEIQLGQNFLLMVPNRPDAIEEFCKVFELGPDCQPEALTRSALLSLGAYLDPQDFDYLFEAEQRGDKVLFIEQLDLVMNQPPRVKPYLVYSPVWGIISQHGQLSAAKEAYYDYANSFLAFRPRSDAGIYKWNENENKWQILAVR